MNYKKILVTGSSAVLGTGVKAISGEFSKSEFIFLTNEPSRW